ncbi:MAG: DUF6790 family protein [Vicinamibacterales bacterium]
MEAVIRLLLENFTVTMLVAGFAGAGVSLAAARRTLAPGAVPEALLAWFVLCSIGIAHFYNFVMHVFFGGMIAEFIGWADSPFQREVGFASLGFSIVGFLAFRGSFDMRLAAIVAVSCFLLGAAGGHVVEMVRNANFAPGNAGAVFYTDIAVPAIGFTLLWLRGRRPVAG